MGKKAKFDLKEMIEEHKNLIRVLRSPSHKDDLKEAKKQSKELKHYKKLNKSMDEVYSYTGPMTAADVTVASWNEYFAEGGMLNQPAHLANNRLHEIRKQFELLSRYHKKN